MAGGNATIWINGKVAAGATGSITNTATVTSATPGTSATFTVVTPLTTGADLVLVKTGTPTANPGDTVAYTVTVRNLGPSDAANVVVTDTLPAGLTFVSAPGCSASGNVVTCTVGTLAVNVSVQRVIAATVNGTVAPGTSLENSAVVTSTTGDSNPLNNSATADTSILGYADLTISKSQLTPNPIAAGSLVTYTIRITNTGPGLARNVDVKDQLPAGMNLVSANASDGGVCGGAVCQFGTLPVSATRTITVVARVDGDAATAGA